MSGKYYLLNFQLIVEYRFIENLNTIRRSLALEEVQVRVCCHSKDQHINVPKICCDEHDLLSDENSQLPNGVRYANCKDSHA